MLKRETPSKPLKRMPAIRVQLGSLTAIPLPETEAQLVGKAVNGVVHGIGAAVLLVPPSDTRVRAVLQVTQDVLRAQEVSSVQYALVIARQGKEDLSGHWLATLAQYNAVDHVTLVEHDRGAGGGVAPLPDGTKVVYYLIDPDDLRKDLAKLTGEIAKVGFAESRNTRPWYAGCRWDMVVADGLDDFDSLERSACVHFFSVAPLRVIVLRRPVDFSTGLARLLAELNIDADASAALPQCPADKEAAAIKFLSGSSSAGNRGGLLKKLRQWFPSGTEEQFSELMFCADIPTGLAAFTRRQQLSKQWGNVALRAMHWKSIEQHCMIGCGSCPCPSLPDSDCGSPTAAADRLPCISPPSSPLPAPSTLKFESPLPHAFLPSPPSAVAAVRNDRPIAAVLPPPPKRPRIVPPPMEIIDLTED